MSFPNQSFNDNNIAIKTMGGEEKLCICFGEEKGKNESFHKK